MQEVIGTLVWVLMQFCQCIDNIGIVGGLIAQNQVEFCRTASVARAAMSMLILKGFR